MFSFGLVQNFEPFSRPFRATVEKSYLVQFDVELSQLSKNVQDLKIGLKMAIGPPYYVLRQFVYTSNLESNVECTNVDLQSLI